MNSMSSKIYQKENNLFQSLNWLAFQEHYGRRVIDLGESSAIELSIPFGKKFLWVQKGPAKLPSQGFEFRNFDKEVVFIRVEPESVTEAQIKTLNLRIVTKKSLLSGQASPKATRVLDLTKTEEELLAEMKPKTRYNIRLAEKKGVTVKRLNNEDILFEMLEATAQKGTGYSPHEKSYYTKLMQDLAKNDAASIFVAEYEGEFLAAIMMTKFGKVATYLHGGQGEVHKNLMAPYLCQWVAIKTAKEAGCELYDFWGVSENDDPTDPWAGISRFKEGFGGQKVIFPGSFDLVIQPFWYSLLTTAATLKHIIKRS
jgi:lipid II:glycine glycyltransferase (peptidoglycan interpeptide bridge formation enzyme)